MPHRHHRILQGLLAVDPGDNTGWAYFDGSISPMVGQITLSRSKNVVGQPAQLEWMWEKFSALLSEVNPRGVILEAVEFWSGSVKSRAAASRQNLSKLAYLVGGYGSICTAMGIEWGLLPSRNWKGQMDDAAVKARVIRANGLTYATPHITDAVGIGLHFAGVFTKVGPHAV